MAPSTVVGQVVPGKATPASYSALDGERLRALEVVSAGSLTALAPNFASFQSGNERVPRFSSRGLRENNFMDGQPAVSLYLDDVPFDTLYGRGVPLLDVDTMEIWRDPQGTLLGAAPPGGTLQVRTHAPNAIPHGYASLAYGNYNQVRTEAGLSGPVAAGDLFAGFAGLYDRRDGFVFNEVTGRNSDTQLSYAGRAQMRWTPTEKLEVCLTLGAYQYDDGMSPGVPLGEDLFSAARNVDGYDRQTSNTESLRARLVAGEVQLTSVSAHTGWHEATLQDGDLQPEDLVRTEILRDAQTWTEELRAESLCSDTPFRWRAGGFFSWTSMSSESAQILHYGPDSATDQTIGDETATDYALFGECTTALEPFELTLGLRFQYSARSADAVNYSTGDGGQTISTSDSGSAVFRSAAPKVALAFLPNTRTRFWASVTKGFQPGGYRLAISPELPEFDRSDSWHYEIGARWSREDENLWANCAAFYAPYTDYQVLRPTSFGSFTMANAREAQAIGVEAEIHYRPLNNVELGFSGGWTRARFEEFLDSSTGENFSGNAINFVPLFTLDGSLVWKPFAGWFARLDAQGVGSYWLDEANIHQQNSYCLLNARVGYAAPRWTASLFGNNLLDQEYVANAIQFILPPGQNLLIVVPGEPLVFGGEISVAF